MPATRSRTEHWRRSLEQVASRGGTVEVTVARDGEHQDALPDLLWRVRVVRVGEEEILIEEPSAMGRSIELTKNVGLLVVFTIGQNRWRFNSTLMSTIELRSGGKPMRTLRISVPTTVERCKRRDFHRLDTAALKMPKVHVWPLLDPTTVAVAEQANELGVDAAPPLGPNDPRATQDAAGARLDIPEVGPGFTARLMNIGGGGVGLLIDPADASALTTAKHFWLRVGLPTIDKPICVTAKLAHHRIESSQHTYAGMAFDFAFNPSHERFVVDRICAYVEQQQKQQLLSRKREPATQPV